MRKPLGNEICRGELTLPFREAVQVGNTVYLSGFLAMDQSGKIVGDDIERQTALCFERIAEVLERYGLGLDGIFKVTA
jgi:enamine deaminase RidA (YjgF/YER057c/UK114 family)